MRAELIPVTSLDGVVPGVPSEATGRAQVAYLESAVADALAGKLDALVTAPINKASCLAAGFAFPGHTEFLQARLGAAAVTMMFAGPRMRVSLATIHHALAEVPRVLSAEAIATGLRTAGRWCATRRRAPRIAVAGLNPHAGEQNHFGDDETRDRAGDRSGARAPFAAAGIDAELPRVPDACFAII